MMRYSRWLTLWVAIALTSLLLAACGDATSTSAPAAGNATTTASSGATGAAPGTTGSAATAGNSGPATDLTLWMSPAVSEQPPPPADWEGYKIIKEKLNINLKYTPLPGSTSDADTKLNTAAASNALPDLFQNTNLDLFYKWQEQGLLAPVTSILPLMPERTKLRYSNPNLNKVVSIGGVQYGLQEPDPFPQAEGLVIRKDWLDKLGLKAPTTLDELLEVAKAFTEKDPDGNGKNDTYGFGTMIDGGNIGLGKKFDWVYSAYGVAGTWNLSADKFGLNYRDPNYEKATEYVQKLVSSKVIDPDWPTMKKDDFRARWKQGKYGIMWEQFCALACEYNYKAFDTNFPNGVWQVLDAPKGPEGKSGYSTYIETGYRFVVSKKALDAGKGPAIAKFLEWANSGEGYYFLGFGQEGVNYKKDASGNISAEGMPKPYTAVEQQQFQQLRNLAYNANPVESRIRVPAWKTSAGRSIDPLEIYNTFAKQPWVNATATLLIKPAASQTDINRFVGENLVQFALGQKPLNAETWNSFVKGMDGIGAADWEASAKKSLQDAGFLK